MGPARTWGVHAVGVAPTERLKLKRQMAAAGGKRGQPRSHISWKRLALKWKMSSLPLPLRLGQKELGLANGAQNKKKH